MQTPRISKIINVYQEEYVDGEYCTGLGDFIRGSLCLSQYAAFQNLDFDMHYTTHPISHFLDPSPYGSNNNPIIHPYRVLCYKSNHKNNNNIQKIIQDFNQLINKHPKCIQTNKHNTVSAFTLYTIAYPSQPITQLHINRVRDALCPNAILQTRIAEYMTSVNIRAKKYNVIHVRSGDNYLLNKINTSMSVCIECKRAFLQVFSTDELTNGIKSNEENEERLPFVLISDNVELKKQLKRGIPNLITRHHLITHMGEKRLNTNTLSETDMVQLYENVANTLIDFFIISKAHSVYAFSTMEHGTGFSEQCCRLYNVPYSSYTLSNIKY